MHSQKAASAYFTIKQILPFGFAGQYVYAHGPYAARMSTAGDFAIMGHYAMVKWWRVFEVFIVSGISIPLDCQHSTPNQKSLQTVSVYDLFWQKCDRSAKWDLSRASAV